MPFIWTSSNSSVEGEKFSLSFLLRCKKGSQRLRKLSLLPPLTPPPAGCVGKGGEDESQLCRWARVLRWFGSSTSALSGELCPEDGEQLCDADN